VTTVRGKFDTVEGELELDEAHPTNARGEIRVAASSLSTGIGRRDDHLRSADFLDAEHHPPIIAQVAKIERRGDRYRVTTDLTIRGLTRPLVLTAKFLGIYPGMRGGRRVGFALSGTIARKVWGLNWNVALEAGGWLVGEDVKVEVEVAAEEAVGSPPA